MAKEKKSKEEVEAEVAVAPGMVAMIWTHKKRAEGTVESVFGLEGVANKDGFLVVQVPKKRAKNELTRRPNCLLPLDYYEKRKSAQEAMLEEFNLED